jgi:hypothetical protein
VSVKNKIEENYIPYNFTFKVPSLLISCEDAQTGKELYFSSPPPLHTLPGIKDLVAALAMPIKVMK